MAERTTSQVAGAAVLGGLVGAGVAILFAPKSGKETRQQIHDKMDHVKDEAQAKLQKAKGDARDLRNRLAEAAHKTGRKAKAEMEELSTPVRNSRQSSVLSAWEEEV